MSKHYKLLISFSFLFFLAFSGLKTTAQDRTIEFTQEETDWISSNQALKVANAMDWPPFNFVEDNVPQGYSIDLIQLVSEKTGLQLQFVSGNTWTEIVNKFKLGELDILPSVYLTENREDFISFTKSYAANPSILVVNAQSTNLKTLEDLSFKQVAVVSNYATAEVLEVRHPSIIQVPVKNAAEGLNAVSVGNVDGFIGSIGPVTYLINKNFIPNIKIIGDVQLMQEEETQLHFGVAKDRIVLRDILQKGLNAVSAEEANTIRQKWMPVNIVSEQKKENIYTSDLWRIVIAIILLFIFFYFGFKWLFKRIIKEKIALGFGSKKFRIKTNFYLTVLVFIVAGLGWLSIVYIEVEFSKNIKLQLENDLNSANGRINFWLDQKKNYLKSLGHDQKLVDLTNELLKVSKNNDKEHYKIVHNDLKLFFDKHNYKGSFIINEHNINIGSLDTSLVGKINTIAQYRPKIINQVFKGIVAFIPPILIEDENDVIDGVGNNTLMYFVIPIENTSHEIIATLIQEIDPTLGFSEILQLSHVGETGESYIFNQKGRMLSRSRFEKDLIKLGVFQMNNSGVPYIEIRDPEGNLTEGFIPQKQIAERSLTLMAENAVQGKHGVNIDGYNDYRGVSVMGAWMWIDDLELGLATEIDSDEALSLYYFIRFSAIAVIGITLIFIIGAILFVLSLGEKANVALIKAKNELENKVNLRTSELSNEKVFLNSLINAIPDLIFYKDAENKYLGANEAFEKQVGIKTADLIGLSDSDILPKEIAEKFRVDDEKILKSEEAKLSESANKDKEGKSTYFETLKTPFYNDEGNISGLIGISRDITVRKKAESRLKSQSTALKSAGNGIVITNAEGNIEWVNPAFTKLTGYTWREAVGKNPSVLNSGKHDEKYFKDLWSTISKGDTWHGDVINKKKNGELYYEEMTITPIINEKGEISQYVAIKQDITKRKELEAQIKLNEERLSLVMQGSNDGIWDLALDTGEIYINDRFLTMLGFEAGELESTLETRRWLTHPDDKEISDEMFEECIAGKREIYSLESQFKCKSGGYLWVLATGRVTKYDENGVPLRFSGTNTDISERKKLELALEKANERMSGELNVAKDIQMSMLPLIFPAFPKRDEIDIYAELIPAREVGGDFYDFHFLDDNHLCFVMADVSGKGVPAALMMAVTKTLLKSRASNDKSPASILTDVNNEIAKDNDSYMFITVFLAILNTNTGELIYSNAGHNPSYIISKENKELTKLGDLHGPVIGAMEGMTYGETKLLLKKNDIVFSYTDGVTESHNINSELYSDPRLEELLVNADYDSSKKLGKLVIESVKEFEGEAEQFDDITVMAIEYCHNPNTVSSIKSTIDIKNDLKQISTAIERFEEFALENKMPFAIIQKINIALDEILNNIISYGYDDKGVHEIEIEIELRSERLIIIIRDDGIPFNPFKNDPPDTMLSVEERLIGGLGIHIVKKLMDEYEYKRQTNKNTITLIKHNINT